jgi:hypothetical protein
MYKIITWTEGWMQWLQNPSQMNGVNIDKARCDDRRKYLKDKINKIKTAVKTKLLQTCREE